MCELVGISVFCMRKSDISHSVYNLYMLRANAAAALKYALHVERTHTKSTSPTNVRTAAL